ILWYIPVWVSKAGLAVVDDSFYIGEAAGIAGHWILTTLWSIPYVPAYWNCQRTDIADRRSESQRRSIRVGTGGSPRCKSSLLRRPLGTRYPSHGAGLVTGS